MASKISNKILVQVHYHLGNDFVAEVNCLDYDNYIILPEVIEFQGRVLGKTEWNSDLQKACYKSSCKLAKIVR